MWWVFFFFCQHLKNITLFSFFFLEHQSFIDNKAAVWGHVSKTPRAGSCHRVCVCSLMISLLGLFVLIGNVSFFPLPSFKIFSSLTVKYLVYFYVYFTWCSLSWLYLWVDVLIKFGNFIDKCIIRFFSVPFSLFPPETSILYIIPLDSVPQVTEALSISFQNFSSLCFPFLFFNVLLWRYSWCAMLHKFQVYNIVIHSFWFVNVMCHPDGFAGVEPSLHLWGKSHLVMVYGSYNVHWIQLTNASLRIFASMFISDIGSVILFFCDVFVWFWY